MDKKDNTIIADGQCYYNASNVNKVVKFTNYMSIFIVLFE